MTDRLQGLGAPELEMLTVSHNSVRPVNTGGFLGEKDEYIYEQEREEEEDGEEEEEKEDDQLPSTRRPPSPFLHLLLIPPTLT